MQVIQMASIPPTSCKKVKILDFFMPYLYIAKRGLFRKISADPLLLFLFYCSLDLFICIIVWYIISQQSLRSYSVHKSL